MEMESEANVAKNWLLASVIMCFVAGSLFLSESYIVKSDSSAQIQAQNAPANLK